MAPKLPIAPYGRYITPINNVTLPGVPFPVSLHRIAAPAIFRGRLDVLHLAPDDLEPAREERIRKACDDKYPKLAAWKRTHESTLWSITRGGLHAFVVPAKPTTTTASDFGKSIRPFLVR